MKAFFGIAAAVILAGCATSRQMVLPDGSAGHAIRCDGAMLSMSDCAIKAGELCPRGYDVAGTDGSSSPMMVASGGIFSAGSVVTRSMLVRCRA